MAGLYIHIPFCRQKCHYCNFYSLATKKFRPEIVRSIQKEMELNRNFFGDNPLNTIYFGGGTPSLLNADQLDEMLKKAGNIFRIATDAEITVEANPDDISEDWLASLRQTPVNRLSIGIQSFRDEDLQYLNRIHSANDAIRGIHLAKHHGYTNFSVDMIYGIPTLSDRQWIENISRALELEIPHISAYALTVEMGTALDHFIRKGKYTPVEDEKSAGQFQIMMEMMGAAGYEHYEISNFALPGSYSRHNTSYWTGEKYLGLGPSAHSYDGAARRWNVANISDYLDGVEKGNDYYGFETLTKTQQFNEYMMTSLRTQWGIDTELARSRFGENFLNHLLKEIKLPLQQGLLIIQDHKITLTKQGKLYADGIAARLFIGE